ncbi:MAG: hypothetical protein PHH28_05725 [Desulfuromonadaceae bacterium]|nr:hypothetical protein [Desulfuromonadaceae bacterium]
MSELIFLLLLFGLPAALGFKYALSRGKNPLLWGLLAGVFPFFLVVLHFHLPTNEIRGHFRKCRHCGRTFPWKDSVCKYCGTSASDSDTI